MLAPGARNFRAVSACAWGRRNTQYTPTHCIANRPSKLMLCSTAKAGKATVVAMMIAHTKKTQDAVRWLKSKRMASEPGTTCGGGWLCIMLVRDPLDRALSPMNKWQALAEVVGSAAAAGAGNYTFKQHHPDDLARDSLQGDVWRAAFGERASPFKLVTVENLSNDLMAVDNEFRNGKLGLGSLSRGSGYAQPEAKRGVQHIRLCLSQVRCLFADDFKLYESALCAPLDGLRRE
ncbi:hypothetical protein T492DRAFT_865678 [Pavlovales sp. CCMP2436]|nr:hypothetical protein T492DRAFT_865678 [Pavlovales sp. CCMP2436]